MAAIRPFYGVRYAATDARELAKVVSAPYDIISPEAQRDYYARHPHNVVRLELGFEEADDRPGHDRYSRAATIYREWRQAGILRAEAQPSFYLVEEEFCEQGRTLVRRSLFAPVRLARWDENVVLPHEFTMSGPKIDRLNLLRATRTQFSPLLAMYDDPGPIGDVLKEVAAGPPVAEVRLTPGSVAAAAESHRVWTIEAPGDLDRLVDAFRSLPIYIADGHHRYETALAYRDEMRRLGADSSSPSEYVLMALVETSDPGLLVLPTHRMLRGLAPIERAGLRAALAEEFEIDELPVTGEETVEAILSSLASATRPAFAVLGLESGVCHRLILRPGVNLERTLPQVPEVLRALDTVVLQKRIFEPLFGLTEHDVEAGERIFYTRSVGEALAAIRTGEATFVFFVNPTTIAQIRTSARAGQRMPQKSTYFYPKPVTGLLFFDHVANATL
ncbi:MAG TPA: DUF1015 domain-containing protein [Chloroflexota bacterium]|nr:DUF1015 domain-containing protein [Chloroflexota bacterium]